MKTFLSLNVLNELAKQLQDLLHPFYTEINPRYQRNVTLADVIEHNTQKKKCPSADKPAPHIPHFVSQSPCCRTVMFAVIHRCMCSSVSSLSLFPKAAAALLQILRIPRPCWGRTGGPRRDPRTKTGPQLLSIWTSDPAKHHNTISALICEAFSCS